MIYVTTIGTVALLTVGVICYWITSDLIKDFRKERESWSQERQILLNRIEDPKYRPQASLTVGEKQQNVEELKRLREEAEQFGLVGRIVD